MANEDNLVAISLSYEPASLTPGYIELKTPYGGEDVIRVWTDSDKQNLVIPNGSDPYKRWPVGMQPTTLYAEGYVAGTAQLWLLYTPDEQVYPGGSYNHDPVKFTVVQVVDVAVDVSDNDTHEIPSMQDASQVPDDHFVTVKGVPGNITLKATISPDTDDARNAITWTGMTQDPEDKLKATKSRAAAGKFPATINVSGRDAKDLTNWVVWSSASSELHFGEEEGGIKEEVEDWYTKVWGGYDVTHAIIAASIIPDSMEPPPDVPDLRGANNDDPPNVPEEDTGVYNKWESLANGVNKKWDASRQVRWNILNPDGLDLSKVINWFFYFYTSYPNYPTDDVCGNDDMVVVTGWEDNDPYAEPYTKCVWFADNPSQNSRHRVGEGDVGDTWEKRIHFRSFARLNIGGRWYRISDWYLWKMHCKFKMQNESEAEWDLDFNDDGDKLDTVPIWRDNGSFNALDNDDFD